MSFSEKIKKEALTRSEFRCCICRDLAANVHHIVPKKEKGQDTLQNAAPLCASCHDLFGDNPSKRKKIRQMRDHWWELMAERRKHLTSGGDLDEAYIKVNPDARELLKNDDEFVMYHLVLAHESFEDAAQALLQLVKFAQQDFPDQKRILFLDIEGHRNKAGGFDNDMYELQTHFIIGFLGDYLYEVHMPLAAVRNPKPQINNIPDRLDIGPEE